MDGDGQGLKMTFQCREILRLTALALIVPLCVVFISHDLLLRALYREILVPKTTLFLKVLLFVLDKAFSVLARSAISYIAYAAHPVPGEITFTIRITSVRALKRLIVTFICTFPYNSALASALVIIIALWGDSTLVLVVLLMCYLVGFLYLFVILQFASVLVFLGDFLGFLARGSTKGKMVAAVVILVKEAVYWFARLYVLGWYWDYNIVELEAAVVDICIVVLLLAEFGISVFYCLCFIRVMDHDIVIDKMSFREDVLRVFYDVELSLRRCVTVFYDML